MTVVHSARCDAANGSVCLCDPLDVRLAEIEFQVTAIRKSMDETEAMVRKLIAEVGPVVQDLIPMVQNLTEHPMLRMLLKGKK